MQSTDTLEAIPLRDPMVHDLHLRVSRMEREGRDHQTEMAVMKNDMAYVKESVGGIERGVNKILWAIGLSVLAAATTFVISGGLTIIK